MQAAPDADPRAATRAVGQRTPILHLAFSQYIRMAPDRRADMLAIARLLLDAVADPDEGIAEHPSGQAATTLPALHQAARRWCSAPVVRALLDHGADPAARWQGLTSYVLARVCGNAPAAQVLAQAGRAGPLTGDEAVLAAGAEGGTPSRRLDPARLPSELALLATRVAARPDRLAPLRCLLLAGLDPEQGDGMRLAPQHVAGWQGLPAQLALLLMLAPDLGRRNAYGGDAPSTVIHGAEFCPDRAGRDHLACARLLLEAGAVPEPGAAAATGTEDIATLLDDWRG